MLKHRQPLNNTIRSRVPQDAVTARDAERRKRSARVAERTDGLAVAESLEQDLAGAAGGEEGRGRIARDEAGGAGADKDGVEFGSVGGSVGLVDAGGERLGDDDGVDVVLGEGALEARDGRLVGGADGRQNANLQAVQTGQAVRVGAHAGGLVVVVVGGIGLRSGQAEGGGDADGDVVADAVELDEDIVLDDIRGELRGLEADGVDEELLLDLVQAVEEQTRLGPNIVEGGRNSASELAGDSAARSGEEATTLLLGSLLGRTAVEGVGRVSSGVQGNVVLASTIPVVVVPGNARLVDGQLLKVGATVTVQLRVKVRVYAALQERVVGEINTTNDVAGLELYFD